MAAITSLLSLASIFKTGDVDLSEPSSEQGKTEGSIGALILNPCFTIGLVAIISLSLNLSLQCQNWILS